MRQEIIDQVVAAGFDVWMRDPGDTYLHFTDGKNIGYLEDNRLEGLKINTVHKPNHTSGTGFGIEQGLTRLDKATLSRAFVMCPDWGRHQISSVQKYKNMEDYRSASSFNAEYKLVAEGRKT